MRQGWTGTGDMTRWGSWSVLLLLPTCWMSSDTETPGVLRLVAVGDWGGLPLPPFFTPHQAGVASLMSRLAEAGGLDLVLSLGDHFYLSGVESVDDPRFKHTFEEVFSQQPLLQVPWFLVGGNHDHLGNISAQLAYTRVSPRWRYPALYYEMFLLVPHTNVSLSVLMIDTVLLCGGTDGEQPPAGPADTLGAEEQWDWIGATLARSRSDYLLVAGHYPVWSVGHHGPTSCLVARLRPLLRKYGVTAYLSGHDHNLQFIREDDGSAYVVSGSGAVSDLSTKHGGSVPALWLLYATPLNCTVGGVAYFQVGQSHMTLRLLQPDGTCVYQAELAKRRVP